MYRFIRWKQNWKIKSKDPFVILQIIFCLLIFYDFLIFYVILKHLLKKNLVSFFFFSVYPLGSGSVSASRSVWTFLGSRIRIRNTVCDVWEVILLLCLLWYACVNVIGSGTYRYFAVIAYGKFFLPKSIKFFFKFCFLKVRYYEHVSVASDSYHICSRTGTYCVQEAPVQVRESRGDVAP